jgi:hypothetical protein
MRSTTAQILGNGEATYHSTTAMFYKIDLGQPTHMREVKFAGPKNVGGAYHLPIYENPVKAQLVMTFLAKSMSSPRKMRGHTSCGTARVALP